MARVKRLGIGNLLHLLESLHLIIYIDEFRSMYWSIINHYKETSTDFKSIENKPQ